MKQLADGALLVEQGDTLIAMFQTIKGRRPSLTELKGFSTKDPFGRYVSVSDPNMIIIGQKIYFRPEATAVPGKGAKEEPVRASEPVTDDVINAVHRKPTSDELKKLESDLKTAKGVIEKVILKLKNIAKDKALRGTFQLVFCPNQIGGIAKDKTDFVLAKYLGMNEQAKE